MATSASLALLILRLAGGLTLAAHGAELFGWFGGRDAALAPRSGPRTRTARPPRRYYRATVSRG